MPRARTSQSVPIAHALEVADAFGCALVYAGVGGRMVIAGSVRREEPLVRDLDVLIVWPHDWESLREIEGFDITAMGDRKADGIWQGMQVNLRNVEPKEYGAALDYFTGPKGHNIGMRRLAQARGYKLNEYGLFNINTGARETKGRANLDESDEREIYALLGVEYKHPRERGGKKPKIGRTGTGVEWSETEGKLVRANPVQPYDKRYAETFIERLKMMAVIESRPSGKMIVKAKKHIAAKINRAADRLQATDALYVPFVIEERPPATYPEKYRESIDAIRGWMAWHRLLANRLGYDIGKFEKRTIHGRGTVYVAQFTGDYPELPVVPRANPDIQGDYAVVDWEGNVVADYFTDYEEAAQYLDTRVDPDSRDYHRVVGRLESGGLPHADEDEEWQEKSRVRRANPGLITRVRRGAKALLGMDPTQFADTPGTKGLWMPPPIQDIVARYGDKINEWIAYEFIAMDGETKAFIDWDRGYGCGAFGCVWPILYGVKEWDEMPLTVLKLSGDITEGPAIQAIIDSGIKAPGVARYLGVMRFERPLVYLILRENILPLPRKAEPDSGQPPFEWEYHAAGHGWTRAAASTLGADRWMWALSTYNSLARKLFGSETLKEMFGHSGNLLKPKGKQRTAIMRRLKVASDKLKKFPETKQVALALEALAKKGIVLADVHPWNLGFRLHKQTGIKPLKDVTWTDGMRRPPLVIYDVGVADAKEQPEAVRAFRTNPPSTWDEYTGRLWDAVQEMVEAIAVFG
jgi:hypothetical protein